MSASPTDPVRVTSAGAWFRPADGGAGSLVRLRDGAGIEAALDVLPRVPARPGAARRQVARAWSVLPVRSPPEAAQPPS